MLEIDSHRVKVSDFRANLATYRQDLTKPNRTLFKSVCLPESAAGVGDGLLVFGQRQFELFRQNQDHLYQLHEQLAVTVSEVDRTRFTRVQNPLLYVMVYDLFTYFRNLFSERMRLIAGVNLNVYPDLMKLCKCSEMPLTRALRMLSSNEVHDFNARLLDVLEATELTFHLQDDTPIVLKPMDTTKMSQPVVERLCFIFEGLIKNLKPQVQAESLTAQLLTTLFEFCTAMLPVLVQPLLALQSDDLKAVEHYLADLRLLMRA